MRNLTVVALFLWMTQNAMGKETIYSCFHLKDSYSGKGDFDVDFFKEGNLYSLKIRDNVNASTVEVQNLQCSSAGNKLIYFYRCGNGGVQAPGDVARSRIGNDVGAIDIAADYRVGGLFKGRFRGLGKLSDCKVLP